MELFLFLCFSTVLIIIIGIYCIYHLYTERRDNVRTMGTVLSCEKSEADSLFENDKYKSAVRYERDGITTIGTIYDRAYEVGDFVEVIYYKNTDFFVSMEFYNFLKEKRTKKPKRKSYVL
jgi:hypothetical protein